MSTERQEIKELGRKANQAEESCPPLNFLDLAGKGELSKGGNTGIAIPFLQPKALPTNEPSTVRPALDFSAHSVDLFKESKSGKLIENSAEGLASLLSKIQGPLTLDARKQLGASDDRITLGLSGLTFYDSNRDTRREPQIIRLSDVLDPLAPLLRAQELQRHLESRDNGSGGKQLSIRPDVGDGRVIVGGTPEGYKREIGENYRAALQIAVASEPNRQQELSQIEKKIDSVKKQLGLTHTPTLPELEAMQKPEETTKLSPEKRAALQEMRSLLERKNDLENSSVGKIAEQYEQYLKDTGQKEVLRAFEINKPLLGTIPFQNWLAKTGNDVVPGPVSIGNFNVGAENNPFSYQQKAAEALRRGDTAAAERYFNRAIESANKIDPKKLDEEMARVKAEKAKADPNSLEFRSLADQENQLLLLKASSGLMRTAYADYLARTGHSAEAFQQLNLAADNHIAVEIINGGNDRSKQESGYFARLVDSCMHGNKEMIPAGQVAATHLQEYGEHLKRAIDLSRSDKPEDKQKAEEEFKAARDAAAAARAISESIDNQGSAENARLFAEALKAERKKPPEQQDQEKIKMLEEQQRLYDYLSHLPALTSLAQATAELGVPANGDQANADKIATIRKLLETADNDHHLGAGAQAQLDSLNELVREKSYGEKTLEWFRQNSGTLAAIGVGATVATLTIWSGPGAALAGGAAAGAVAGALTDHVAGNNVNLWSVSEHALEAFGGGVSGLVRRRLLATTGRVLSHPAVAGAAGSASGSAVEHLPTLVLDGPLPYGAEVAWSAGTGAAMPRGAMSKHAPAAAPLFPIFSNIAKNAARTVVEGQTPTSPPPPSQ